MRRMYEAELHVGGLIAHEPAGEFVGGGMPSRVERRAERGGALQSPGDGMGERGVAGAPGAEQSQPDECAGGGTVACGEWGGECQQAIEGAGVLGDGVWAMDALCRRRGAWSPCGALAGQPATSRPGVPGYLLKAIASHDEGGEEVAGKWVGVMPAEEGEERFEVAWAIVEWCGAEQQHLAACDGLCDVPVAGGLLIAQGVGFVDDDEHALVLCRRARGQIGEGGQWFHRGLVQGMHGDGGLLAAQQCGLPHGHERGGGDDGAVRILPCHGERRKGLAESDGIGEQGTAVAFEHGEQPCGRLALVGQQSYVAEGFGGERWQQGGGEAVADSAQAVSHGGATPAVVPAGWGPAGRLAARRRRVWRC